MKQKSTWRRIMDCSTQTSMPMYWKYINNKSRCSFHKVLCNPRMISSVTRSVTTTIKDSRFKERGIPTCVIACLVFSVTLCYCGFLLNELYIWGFLVPRMITTMVSDHSRPNIKNESKISLTSTLGTKHTQTLFAFFVFSSILFHC